MKNCKVETNFGLPDKISSGPNEYFSQLNFEARTATENNTKNRVALKKYIKN